MSEYPRLFANLARNADPFSSNDAAVAPYAPASPSVLSFSTPNAPNAPLALDARLVHESGARSTFRSALAEALTRICLSFDPIEAGGQRIRAVVVYTHELPEAGSTFAFWAKGIKESKIPVPPIKLRETFRAYPPAWDVEAVETADCGFLFAEGE